MNNKAVIAGLFSAGILGISLVSCLGPLIPKATPTYIDGTYTGVGEGMMGDIRVEVVIKQGEISSVVLKEHKETDGIYQKAEKSVIESILQQQTTDINVDVDSISGATQTADGIKKAVKDALSNAVKK